VGDMQLPPDFSFPKYGYWLSRLVDRTVWPGLGLTHDDLGALCSRLHTKGQGRVFL
jgi:hypothetical protein